MIRSLVSGAALAAVTVFIPTAAHAQSVVEPNTVTATPFLSVSFGTSNDLGSSLGIGGAIGYDWTRHLGFEFEVGRVFDVVGDDDAIDWSLTNINANVIYHFNAPRVTPYAIGGLGWERSSVNADDEALILLSQESSTEVAWNIGGGVKVPVGERLVARADLRRFQVNDLAPDHWRLYGGLTFWIKR
ncbi:MAG: porin family protein [Acidobacteria bacterium]|nr:porin family protein [Acidobacteriota bacterium]